LRKTLLLAATAAATLISAPAAARDGQPYVGISGGILFPKDQDIDLRTITPGTTVGTTVVTDYGNALSLDYKRGYDVDATLGYDFGLFRLEGELGYKRAKLDNFELSSAAQTAFNTQFGGVVDPEVDFDLSGRTSVLSGMVNGLVDFGAGGFSVFAGGGAGRARVKFAGERDNAWAYQLLAGVTAPISDNVDVGVKYRYFRTGKLDFFDFDDGAILDNGSGSTAFANAENRFRSHSVLASLTFNFGGRAEPLPEPAPAPAPVVEAAPPPPPPATQTCPDGSVVLATDSCPLPPPPPPAPEPAPVRG